MRTRATQLLIAVSLLLLGGSAAAAPQAGAASRTVVLPIEMDWRIHQEKPTTCSSWGFVTWPAQEGAIGWELFYTLGGEQRSKTLTPPFSDTEFEKWGWSPGPGMHWFQQSYYGRSAFTKTVSCDEGQARQKAAYSDVRLEITLEPETKIAGVVKARDGSPLRGVRVLAGGHADRTDAKGRYSIVVPGKEHTYRVRASGPGFEFRPPSRRVAVRPGQTSRASFRAEGYAIVARVIQKCPGARASADPAGQQTQCKPAVKGAKVTARKLGEGKVIGVKTLRDGTAVMMVEEKGVYVVKFSVDGKTWTKKKRVSRGRVYVTQDIGNRNHKAGGATR